MKIESYFDEFVNGEVAQQALTYLSQKFPDVPFQLGYDNKSVVIITQPHQKSESLQKRIEGEYDSFLKEKFKEINYLNYTWRYMGQGFEAKGQ